MAYTKECCGSSPLAIDLSSIHLRHTEPGLHLDGSSGGHSREDIVLEVPSLTDSSSGSPSLSSLRDAVAAVEKLQPVLSYIWDRLLQNQTCAYPVHIITRQPSSPWFVPFAMEPVAFAIRILVSGDLCQHLNDNLLEIFPNANSKVAKCYIERNGILGLIKNADALWEGDAIYAFDTTGKL